MEIAVLGGGHGCYAAAADAAEAGHNVRFWRRDTVAFRPILERSAIAVTDFRGQRDVTIALATTDIAEAMDGADLILSPLPGTAQRGLCETMAPHLKDGQVVFVPPGTMGSYLMAKQVLESGNNADVCATTLRKILKGGRDSWHVTHVTNVLLFSCHRINDN